MPSTPQYVNVDPGPMLHERSFGANGLSYDPDLGVLTFQLDRTLTAQQVQFMLPAVYEEHTLAAVFPDATRENPVIDDGEWILLPRLVMYQEQAGEISFEPPSTEGRVPRPKVKIKITIRVRPTGGG